MAVMIALRKIVPVAVLVAMPAFAQAAPIPKPVADMIRGAVENEEPAAANAVDRPPKSMRYSRA
jgi:hypothetical protein